MENERNEEKLSKDIGGHIDNDNSSVKEGSEALRADNDHEDNLDNVKAPPPRRKSSVWVLVKKKMSVTEKGATPIKWKMLLLVFLALFGSAFSLTFLFPFLPEMVLWFGYHEEDKGYYAGFIASAVFFGRTMGSFFWGWLSDKFGRPPIILITVFLNGLFSLAFGFTFNFPMAVITRFLTGLANGTVGTAKTVIYEISDNTNQAVGMSFLSMSWGAGLILGPTFGGLLANPVKRYPAVFGGSELLTEFPYLLPGLLVFIVCTIVSMIEFFCLPETLHSKREDMEFIVEERKPGDKTEDDKEINILVDDEDNDNDDKNSVKNLTTQAKPKISMSVENLHLENEAAYYQVQLNVCSQESLHKIDKHVGDKDCIDDEERSTLLKRRVGRNGARTLSERQRSQSESLNGTGHLGSQQVENGSIHSCSIVSLTKKSSCNGCEITVEEIVSAKRENVFTRCCKSVGQMSLFRLLSQSDVRHPVILYMIFSFAVIGYEEIFTVWASTDPLLDGLGFEPGEIGAVLGISAVPLLLLNAYVFPWCARKFGIKNTFLGSAGLMMILLAVQPVPHLLYDKRPELWTCLLVIILPLKISISCCFTATALFVNNSVEPSQAGAVNGIAMTSTAIGRTLAPTVGGSIFAWSVSYGAKNLGAPFDVSLAFFVMSLCTFVTIIHAATLPERLTRQKK